MLNRAVRRLQKKADQLTGAPLFRAAQQKRIALHFHKDRIAALPQEFLAADLPALLIITDDDDHATGPSGWSAATAAIQWAATGYPFANRMDNAVYKAIVEETISLRRFLLIETTGPYVNAWRRALGGSPEQLTDVADAERAP